MTDFPRFRRVAFIGIGLIGSSLARVLRRDHGADAIVACAPSAATREKALALGIADAVTADPAEAAAGADLVVVATPLSAYAAVGAAIAPALKPGRDRHRCRLGQAGGDPRPRAAAARRASISCPAIRSPAPSIRARRPASPSCSRTAGAS